MTATNTEPEPHEAFVAANVQALRKSLGLSQKQLATKAGVGEMVICTIENGRRRINVEDLFTLAEALDATVHQLLAPDCALDVAAGAVQYAITFDRGVTDTVVAHRVEETDGWVNFYFAGELIYFAGVDRVLGVRLTQGSQQ